MLSLERQNLPVHCVRPFEDWGKLIGDVPAATAILDRFLHHAEVIEIQGQSYRMKDRGPVKKNGSDSASQKGHAGRVSRSAE